MACKIETLQKEHQSNMRNIKAFTREIRELMNKDGSAKDVQFEPEKLIQLYENEKHHMSQLLYFFQKRNGKPKGLIL